MLKISAKQRLLEASNWSEEVTENVKDEDRPKEGTFKGSAASIAKELKRLHPDLKSASSALQFYLNRAGKNLSAEDRKRVEDAGPELRRLYGEDK